MEHMLYIENLWDGMVLGGIAKGSRESITELEVCKIMMDDEKVQSD